MPERDAQDHDVVLGLARLPPGRHGLSRDFVVKNQRDRLTAAIIGVVAERGYHEATVSQICAAAGVSRRTFYTYFTSKEECYLQASELIGEHVAEAMAEAGAGGGSWPVQVRARLAALLETYAANPALARFTLVAPLRAGAEIGARQPSAPERILRSLSEGKPHDRGVKQPSAAIEQTLAGGLVGVIAHKVERGEGEQLIELLPDLTELFLTPYIGREKAARIARAAS
ncbi:MAG TPA: helix-turn-helix domain-containing protein [Solirubrobacterales bacterium]|nr:helix-turn-helix domain-containing protein [Solirubrobacterales bacterium]